MYVRTAVRVALVSIYTNTKPAYSVILAHISLPVQVLGGLNGAMTAKRPFDGYICTCVRANGRTDANNIFFSLSSLAALERIEDREYKKEMFVIISNV